MTTTIANNTLATVKVNLADGTSYTTSVNAARSDESIRDYFVGTLLNMGSVDDRMVGCTCVEIDRS